MFICTVTNVSIIQTWIVKHFQALNKKHQFDIRKPFFLPTGHRSCFWYQDSCQCDSKGRIC